ncbi:MAG TPA: YfcE family phosphodiesterase [Planctomycetaceae bacterium]|nr:YfcE family phosphodiesterase [Planctomycetaceae bacterium]HIQ22768.1 YfcE family phosphodiesterase [Planctomycetota bacterium]
MMRVLCITDLHGRPEALDRILADAGPVDLVLLGGDITSFGTPHQAAELVEQAQSAGAPVLAVAGNCDSRAIDQRLAEMGVGLHGSGRVHRGVAVQGLSAMPPWLRQMYQFTEEELAAFLAAGCQQLGGIRPHVVLSHCPPRDGPVDRTWLGKHVGSTALREFIQRHQPDLVVCGHIHEARGMTRMGTTLVVNCGIAGRRFYAVVRVSETVEAELRRAPRARRRR